MKTLPYFSSLIRLAGALLFVLVGCSNSRAQKNQEAMSAQPTPLVSAPAAPTVGIGILGDSNSDEYQADDGRGGKYNATTLNWVELLVRDRGLNFGPGAHGASHAVPVMNITGHAPALQPVP